MIAKLKLRIPTAAVFEPLLHPSRYKGAWGGRGSGKSHFFAGMLIEDHLRNPGMRSVCIREVQKSLKQSAKKLLEDKIADFGLTERDGFKVYREVIETPGDGIISFTGMQDHTADSVKSMEGVDRAWVEEAQSLSDRSLTLLRPTIRKEGSELWFSWNPMRAVDPVDQMMRGANTPSDAVVVRANWSDNPWFPKVLEQERMDALRNEPEKYGHIWEGEYATVLDGAYYARHLTEAQLEGRIGFFAADQLVKKYAVWDIGSTSRKSDATAIWIVQYIGNEVRVLDYYEAVGQPFDAHVNWLRANGYGDAVCVLPHDGRKHDTVYTVTPDGFLRNAGFVVDVVPNQGAGAALMRIDATRLMFPRVRFNAETTEGGREALGWYHEKKDENRGIGLGPEHDWSSHCFVGETQVLTRYGTQRIMDLPETGEVLTPCGWRQYRNPRITRANAPLVEVTFKGGHTVRCTPDHMFLTDEGWKSAQSLKKGSAIQSTLTKSRSILMAAYTACGRARDTYQGADQGFIGTFGSERLAKFQRDATFITKTATFLTTALKTLSAWTRESICVLSGQRSQNPQAVGFLITHEPKRLIGTSRKKAGCGIAGTQKGQKVGQNGSEFLSHARSVVSRLTRWFGKAGIAKFIAQADARPLHIESVQVLDNFADVWCMTVPEAECFSLANGAVVHNCADAFGLVAIYAKKQTAQQGRKPLRRGLKGIA